MAAESAAAAKVAFLQALSGSQEDTSSERLEEHIRALARKFSDQPLPSTDPGVWGVLTAISKNARQRSSGMNILLDKESHTFGRLAEDARFQILAPQISGLHCEIFMERTPASGKNGDLDNNPSVSVFLKDTSTNGTFLNWKRLRKNSPRIRIKHGDIISFAYPPHGENSYAFVYREAYRSINCENGVSSKRKSKNIYELVYRRANRSINSENGVSSKRKSNGTHAENKRQKGIGIGAPDGPILLDDVRSLQRSNTELRQQLESHVLSIEALRSENRSCLARHEQELKDMKKTVTNSHIHQIQDLQTVLDVKNKEIAELNASSAELRHSVEDLNERLSAFVQSRVDADEIINSQKTTIAELEAQLDEERNLRREERDKAANDLKSAVQNAHFEAEKEIKRQAEAFLRQQKEQQEFINKLQDSEKESRFLVESLRCKLENARESLVISEKKVRNLEVLIQDEQTALATVRKKEETLEIQLERLKKEVEDEKAAREQAWSKVSALELEIASAIRDLSIEKQRFQGARERIILRETQLRSFYSTTEEISALFQKQQEQLKTMRRTLEDEENYDSTSLGLDLHEPQFGVLPAAASPGVARDSNTQETFTASRRREEGLGASMLKNSQSVSQSSTGTADDGDDASVTEKHNCEIRTQEEDTQDLEGIVLGTEVVSTGKYPIITERIPETESSAGGDALCQEEKAVLDGGETMQLDQETQVHERADPANAATKAAEALVQMSEEETEIKTGDLLASEAAGSWAIGTAPSVHGENESPCPLYGKVRSFSSGKRNGEYSRARKQAPRAMVRMIRNADACEESESVSNTETEDREDDNDENGNSGGESSEENNGQEKGDEAMREESFG